MLTLIMLLLLLFAFIAGFVTILSPCILPLLPIILSSTGPSGRQRPFGIVVGFIFSFTFFTLFLSSIVKFSGISPDFFRSLSVIILLFFGATMVLSRLQFYSEMAFGHLARLVPIATPRQGFVGGLFVGLSLGLLWTPCVGPILASVISLSLTGSVSTTSFLITAAYSLGTAIPMLLIMQTGSTVLQKIPWLTKHTLQIQRIFGVMTIVTALAILFNLDRRFQLFILKTFPNYGVGLTKFEDNKIINDELKKISPRNSSAPDLIPGGQWFNSPPLELKNLRGKVVLIDFWTYTCINCQRTLPHVKKWWQKYQDKGLVIIGVHSPEFEFEKTPKNLSSAITDFDLDYPIVQDNDFATWRAFDNHYWPAKYLIDKDGHIRYHHFGEGAYDLTEKNIQLLLSEAGQDANLPIEPLKDQPPRLRISPESYLGFGRAQYYFPDSTLKPGDQTFLLAPNQPTHTFSFDGNWTISTDNAIAGDKALLNYHFVASKVYLVIRPPENSQGVVNIYLDGIFTSQITVDSDKLYTLFNSDSVQDHNLKLEFLTPGTEVYAFTFG